MIKEKNLFFIGYDMNSKGYKLYNPSNGKTIISRDVEFDEEGAWDFGSQENDFNFFPGFEEEEQSTVEQQREEPTTPLVSPTPTDDGNSPPSFLKERKNDRTKNLQEIYEVTERLDNLTLFCLFADCELVNF